MRPRQATSLYFATVCFLPAILLVLYPLIFLEHLPVPEWILKGVGIYVWAGVIFVIVRIWRSEWRPDKKGLWTVLILFLGLVTLPIYWFRHVHTRAIST
jgi:chromate transport protein ChrA